MLQFPPLPSWDSLHPLIIHFPIVLLLLSPLFVAISAVLRPRTGRPYMISALLLLLLGTASLFVAVSTGKEAAELAERGGALDAVLSSHESLASETQIVFAGLSAILLGIVILPRVFRRHESRLNTTFLPVAFLALYSVGLIFLVNTAHAGGRLVHEFGVHSLMPAENSETPAPPTEGQVANGQRR